ncbi:Rap1a/Tai family immunity protein [Massilia sp. ST3]|uniref:Rap1a/Tai family immunity protein n=1 Tax=Massilia sp. ST3 TaxID=2824903 RepID=UPI001B83F57E|nr:Rap1a/Tai family immunity protein [Massilia sp. ST3]MBQ5948270.1 hypothetical protein [Massilia sp. ST3]
MPSQAQEASTNPWMTGERLVKLMGNVNPAELAWTPESPFPSSAMAAEYRDMLNGEFVQGYLHALHDASEGKEWCWSRHKPKPDTLISAATHSLQRMPAHQLERNAADLVIEVWRKTWPCPANQRRKP